MGGPPASVRRAAATSGASSPASSRRPTRATWKVGDLAPFVESAIEIFGPARLIFGSDWPVCLLAASYADVVATARELTGRLSRAEREAIFGGAAERAYGLSVAPDGVG